MKELFIIFALLLSITVYGQKFVATAYGLRDSSNIERTFVVINVDGKTAKELYVNAVKYINKTYRNASDVITGKIEGEYLKYITNAPNFVYYKLGGRCYIDGKYTVELTFKDGKVKYEVIELLMYKQLSDGYMNNYFFRDKMMGMFNSKLKLVHPDWKVYLENYFNSNIKSLADALNDKNDNW
jgi:hypothetical protein